MPYKDLVQPEIIMIQDDLRLRKYDGNYKIAVPWYQDKVVYYNSEGITDESKIPDADYVKGMYDYLVKNGECYFIEVLEDQKFVPIGDVTLKEQNPPIVIGAAKYRGIGIGKKVMTAIINRARELGIKKFYGSTVYDYNIVSQKMHESLGYKCVGKEGNEKIYELEL